MSEWTCVGFCVFMLLLGFIIGHCEQPRSPSKRHNEVQGFTGQLEFPLSPAAVQRLAESMSQCTARTALGWACSLNAGHEGDHVAHTGDGDANEPYRWSR